MILTTNSLFLREFVLADMPSVHRYASDLGMTEYMDWGPNSEKDTQDFLQIQLDSQLKSPRTSYVFGITEKPSNEVIGSIGIEVQSSIHRSASFGYILRKDRWEKGIVTEAGKAVLQFGFEQLNLHRIWATYRPENMVSMRVLEKLGFEREGYLRHEKFIRGKYRDSILYAKINF